MINSDIQNIYAERFSEIDSRIMACIKATRIPLHDVMMNYIDGSNPGESLEDWLHSHYRPDFRSFTVPSSANEVPDTAHELIERFSKTPPTAELAALATQAVVNTARVLQPR